MTNPDIGSNIKTKILSIFKKLFQPSKPEVFRLIQPGQYHRICIRIFHTREDSLLKFRYRFQHQGFFNAHYQLFLQVPFASTYILYLIHSQVLDKTLCVPISCKSFLIPESAFMIKKRVRLITDRGIHPTRSSHLNA